MGKNAEAGAGALYRYYRGEVVNCATGITIPNATCFAPDGRHAYFADTAEHVVWRIPSMAKAGRTGVGRSGWIIAKAGSTPMARSWMRRGGSGARNGARRGWRVTTRWENL
jgi:sugar lactone lactonase YvrE